MKTNIVDFDKMGRKSTILGISFIVILVGVIVYSLLAESPRRDMLGVWVVDTAGVEQGFHCGKDGIAASINNSHRQYTNWTANRKHLVLKGKSFENYHVYDIADTLVIKKLNSTTLVADHNGTVTTFRKSR